MNKKKQRLLREVKSHAPFSNPEELVEKLLWLIDNSRLLSVADYYDIVYYLDEMTKSELWHDETGPM